MKLKIQVINQPSFNTLEIVKHRARNKGSIKDKIDSLGLVEGAVIDLLVACDIAEKSADVTVVELTGSCPQHFSSIAVLGSIGAVKNAIERIRSYNNQGQ